MATRPKEEAVKSHGLYLDTLAKGGKSYVWRGRVAGKPVRKVLRHPKTGAVATTLNMTLTEAKTIAKAIIADAAKGEGRHFPAKVEGITVSAAWRLYMERDGDKQEMAAQKRSHFKRHVEPLWGKRIISTITDDDCDALIEGVYTAALARGEVGAGANNLQKTLNTFFRWCVAKARTKTGVRSNPMDGMAMKANVALTKRPPRPLGARELVWLFRALDHYRNAPCRSDGRAQRIRDTEATEFLLRSMCRRTETFSAQWSWLVEGGLSIPAAMTKNGYPILVPLTASMLELIGEQSDDVPDSAPIFVAKVDSIAHTIEDLRPIMNEIARKEGWNGDFDIQKLEDGSHNPDYFTLHDFRDTGKTFLQDQVRDDDEPMFSPMTQEACLNHREKGVGALYNGALDDPRWFYPQRKRAGAFYNDWLDGLKAKAMAKVKLAA